MSAVARAETVRHTLIARLVKARACTEELFELVLPEALYDRPIPERHRIIFYVGHLEAFDWNLIGHHGLSLGPIHQEFDQLFAFGIDPVDGGLPSDQPSDWPPEAEVRRYTRQVRQRLDEVIRRASFVDPRLPLFREGYILHAAIEHRLMHAETLAYMLHQLPLGRKRRQRTKNVYIANPVYPGMIEIPEGTATLGMKQEAGQPFGWDNEFQLHAVAVPRFRMDVYNVTNGEFLEFVRCGAYGDRSLWAETDWKWKVASDLRHPVFWKENGDQWNYHTMFDEIPLPLLWPVYVSHAEASAYARWKGRSLPSEAQWHRAAAGTESGAERLYPWGSARPGADFGNMDFNRWDPASVGAYSRGRSAFGIADLVGNGWEWTSTLFTPFPGFEPFSFYPGYSANFFDGKHYVLKGASPRTAACMLRRSFRNWFQSHYPYVYATFRCVEN